MFMYIKIRLKRMHKIQEYFNSKNISNSLLGLINNPRVV